MLAGKTGRHFKNVLLRSVTGTMNAHHKSKGLFVVDARQDIVVSEEGEVLRSYMPVTNGRCLAGTFVRADAWWSMWRIKGILLAAK